RHTRSKRDWSSDVCSSDLYVGELHHLPEGQKFLSITCTSLRRIERDAKLWELWQLMPVGNSFLSTWGFGVSQVDFVTLRSLGLATIGREPAVHLGAPAPGEWRACEGPKGSFSEPEG